MKNLLIQQLTGSNGPLAGMKIKNFKQVSGGSIHDSWRVFIENGRQLFIKTNSLDSYELLKFEAEGLLALKNFADPKLLVIPQPICITKLEDYSTLVMPWLDLTGVSQASLGHGLASLHKISSQKGRSSFGWDSKGFIGSISQIAGWRASWGECFFDLRLWPQLSRAKNWGLDITSIEKNRSNLVDYLNQHQPLPSLVHGDLWAGNAFVQNDGKGVMLDPAVWWADREVDIAMTKLFGGFSQEFYLSYQNTWPLDITAVKREDIYNLYHLLNHANMFGGSYKTQCQEIIFRLEEIVS